MQDKEMINAKRPSFIISDINNPFEKENIDIIGFHNEQVMAMNFPNYFIPNNNNKEEIGAKSAHKEVS